MLASMVDLTTLLLSLGISLPVTVGQCYPGDVRYPENSLEIFTIFKPEKDQLKSFHICKFGYELSASESDGNRILIFNWCTGGEWKYYPTMPNCMPKRTCGKEQFWIYDNAKCYLKTHAKGWGHSLRLCQMAHGHLIEPKSPKINAYFSQNFGSEAFLNNDLLPEIDYYWLGVVYDENKNVWRYQSSGKPVKWHNWSNLKHTNLTSDSNWIKYAPTKFHVAADRKGRWHIFPSSTFYKYNHLVFGKICETYPKGMGYQSIKAHRLTLIQKTTTGKKQLQIEDATLDWSWVKSVMGLLTSGSAYTFVFDYSHYLKKAQAYLDINWYNFLQVQLVKMKVEHDGIKFIRDNKTAIQCAYTRNCEYMYKLENKVDNKMLITLDHVTRSAVYSVQSEPYGVEDIILALAVDEGDNSTHWSPWLPCICDDRSQSAVTVKFKLRRNLTISIPDEGLVMQKQPCSEKITNQLGCKGLYDWSTWSKCSSGCGMGTKTRWKETHTKVNATQSSSCEGDCTDLLGSLTFDEIMAKFPDLAYWFDVVENRTTRLGYITCNLMLGFIATIHRAF